MLDPRLLQLNSNLITCLGRGVKSSPPILSLPVGRTMWKYNAIHHLINDPQSKLQDNDLPPSWQITSKHKWPFSPRQTSLYVMKLYLGSRYEINSMRYYNTWRWHRMKSRRTDNYYWTTLLSMYHLNTRTLQISAPHDLGHPDFDHAGLFGWRQPLAQEHWERSGHNLRNMNSFWLWRRRKRSLQATKTGPSASWTS